MNRRLEAMTILLAAVDSGGLSAASRALGIPLATVSRRVSELEKHLKIRLFLRGSRSLLLTDAGRDYVASCRRIMEDIAEAERTASGEYRAPQGELTISAAQAIGRSHLIPVVVEFLQTYPDIRVQLQLVDRLVNLLEEGVDVALRVGELPDSSMIAIRVALIREVLCASPSYLKTRGVPKKPTDLSSHDCVTNEGYANHWQFWTKQSSQTVQVSSRLVVNSGEAAAVAASAGAGIAYALSYQVEQLVKSRALVTLLDEYAPPPMPVSLIYPSQRQVPLKLRAFLDFATPRLRKRLGYKEV